MFLQIIKVLLHHFASGPRLLDSLQKLTLRGGEVVEVFDKAVNMQIAPQMWFLIGQTKSLENKIDTFKDPGFQFVFAYSRQGWDLNLTTKCCVEISDGNIHPEVQALTQKDWMILQVEDNEKVADILLPHVAISGNLETLLMESSFGNLNFELNGLTLPTILSKKTDASVTSLNDILKIDKKVVAQIQRGG